MQSEHLAEYPAVLDTLAAKDLLYPCFCTRADIARSVAAPHGPDGAPLYPGTCRRLSAAERADRIEAGQPFALRLDMEAAYRPGLSFHEESQGRVPVTPSGLVTSCSRGRTHRPAITCAWRMTNALQGVTLVTRGEDLRPATDLHRLLQALLGWPEPAYAHHRLLTDRAGRRLAKRDQAQTLRSLRADGVSAREVIRRLA